MILKFIPRSLRYLLVVSTITGSFLACHHAEERIPVEEGNKLSLKVLRFEQDLFNDSISPESRSSFLSQKYGSFFDLFIWELTRLGSKDSSLLRQHLDAFIADTNFRAVYAACEAKYADFSQQESGLSDAFSRYSVAFPGKPVPQLLTTISVFGYPVICDSTHLAISLDMYLNPGSRFYPTLQPPLPGYLQRRMRSEYLVADAMKGWLQSDYSVDENNSDLLEQMIGAGRIQYALKQLLPDMQDTILTGYTADQLKWCGENESQVWSFFIDNKLLYTKDPNLLMKYVGEGPSTNGFPGDSPGNIGLYVGYRIVEAYMQQHPEVTLPRLMEFTDLHALFQSSKYKPRK